MSSPARLRFDFVDGAGTPRTTHFVNPHRLLVAHTLAEVAPTMAAVEEAVANGWYAAGFVAYEAAPAFDAALATRPSGSGPLVWFGLFEAPAQDDAPQTIGGSGPAPADHATATSSASSAWQPDVEEEAYRRGVTLVREAIAAGHSYQANYTFRLNAVLVQAQRTAVALDRLYADLRDAQPVPYAACLDLGDRRILSLSPELFFRVDGRHLVSRPMKGTAPRGRFTTEDAAQVAWLTGSPKNRAENVMIVDLVRNDIGRLAEVGSVRVTALHEVERYASLFQMVSQVEGELRAGVTLTEVFRALFPAGSITGAPKTSSMRLIAEVETTARGVYCGAIGFITPHGQATFSVAIRTAVVDTVGGAATYGVGGGITWDSTADAEHAEALSKATPLAAQAPFELFETMALVDGVFRRRERHLRRLTDSAAYWGFAYDPGGAAHLLDTHASRNPDGSWRVRLRLSRSGALQVDHAPFPAPLTEPVAVALAGSAMHSTDRRLFHKTTDRSLYERHTAAHPGVFDVLLWNERNELTEFTIGNLVVELDGRRWTPPVACGLLPGVLRAELLASGTIGERVIGKEQLGGASRISFINSLRGWVNVVMF